jgi:hypothetical protein
MNSGKKEGTYFIAIGLVSIFIAALAITPLVAAAAPSANNQIEDIRAHAHYKLAAGPVVAPRVMPSLTVSLSPDMQLVRDAASQGRA